MGFQGWGHFFQGPVALPEYLEAKPGVFVVWCVHGGLWDIIDVGEADNVRSFLLSRGHLDDHEAGRPYQVYFSATYLADAKKRLELLKTVKGPSFVPCDLEALKTRKSEAEKDEFFSPGDHVQIRTRHRSKVAAVTVVPGRFVKSLVKRIRELERSKEGRA